MTSITIITIVVVALLSVIIFGLTWLAFRTCIKLYKVEVDQGLHDNEIYKEYHIKKNKKKKKKSGLVGIICSYIVLSALIGLFITGVVYKASGDNISINNQTVLVVKSGSMSGFYNDKLAEKYNNDASLQFEVGDICVFEKVNPDDELIKGEVYGYKEKNNIITHRLKEIRELGYEFQGDANGISDYEYSGHLVQREDIIYHYVGKKIKGVGSFILFAQSYFGIWSLVNIIGVAVVSEVVAQKIDKINKSRDWQMTAGKSEMKQEVKKDEK